MIDVHPIHPHEGIREQNELVNFMKQAGLEELQCASEKSKARLDMTRSNLLFFDGVSGSGVLLHCS